MNAINYLLDEYSGDKAWVSFVDAFRADWDKPSDERRVTLVGLIGEDFAIVLHGVMPGREIEWWKSPIPALGGLTPISVQSEHVEGTKAIRALMMRFPI